MKKIKLLAPILASVATVAPLTTTLANCSCSNIDYTGITKTMKADALNYYQIISKEYRPTFNCQPAYDYIVSAMKALGYTPVYKDSWSEVAATDFTSHQLESPIQGTYGNIAYDIPASEGCETWPKIIFSAYYDMVYDFPSGTTEETKKKIKDEGIPLHVDEESQKLYSEGSVCACGFNDGLGIASMLTLAKNQALFSHGPIRLLFTADSGDSTPTYASGADYLKVTQKTAIETGGVKPLDTPYVINSDGNVQAEINVSSAGIHQCEIKNKVYTAASEIEEHTATDFSGDNPSKWAFDVKFDNLSGGHSATDINDDRANAIKVLFEFLTTAHEGFRLVSASSEGAGSGYKIPNAASARFILNHITSGSGESLEKLTTYMKGKIDTIIEAYENAFPNEKGKIKYTLERVIPTSNIVSLSESMSLNVCSFIDLMKFGPQVWFDEKHEEVKTSCNIGPFEITTNDTDKKVTLNGRLTCRSANQNQLSIFSGYTHSFIKSLLHVGDTEYTDYDTPVWENSEDLYKVENKMANLFTEAYKRFRYTPKEVNCHGWLEAACFVKPITMLGDDVVPYIATIGPTIANPQTANEVLYISTLNSCIRSLIYVLHNANALNNK